MSSFKLLGSLAAAAALSLTAVACGGADASAPNDNAAPSDENDIKSGTCGPATTLTCAPGYEITTQGCASSRVAGAPPQGRCVNVDAAKIEGSWLEDLASAPLEGSSFYSYTFAADGTYTSRGGCRQDTPGIHCNAISVGSGKWTLGKSGPQLGAPAGAAEITLVDSFNQKETYFYTVADKKLTLSATVGFGAKPSTFAKQ